MLITEEILNCLFNLNAQVEEIQRRMNSLIIKHRQVLKDSKLSIEDMEDLKDHIDSIESYYTNL